MLPGGAGAMLWLMLLFDPFNFLQVFKMSLPITAFFALGTGIELMD